MISRKRLCYNSQHSIPEEGRLGRPFFYFRKSNNKGAEMRTWKIVAIIYSIIGWMVISTVNLGSDDPVPFKEEKTLTGYIAPREMVIPPIPPGYIPMRSLTYPSKILGFYSPHSNYSHYMKPKPVLDRYQQPNPDSSFYADEIAQ